MNRADKIKAQMAELQEELNQLAPFESMKVRDLAKASGVSRTTASRFKAGDYHDMQLSTIQKLLPFVAACPCCGADQHPDQMPLFESSRTQEGETCSEE